MSNYFILYYMQNSIYYSLIAIFMVTIPILVVGFVVSILQAATQINEPTMAFIPKIIVMFLVLWLLGPWFIEQLIDFTRQSFLHMSEFIK